MSSPNHNHSLLQFCFAFRYSTCPRTVSSLNVKSAISFLPSPNANRIPYPNLFLLLFSVNIIIATFPSYLISKTPNHIPFTHVPNLTLFHSGFSHVCFQCFIYAPSTFLGLSNFIETVRSIADDSSNNTYHSGYLRALTYIYLFYRLWTIIFAVLIHLCLLENSEVCFFLRHLEKSTQSSTEQLSFVWSVLFT